MNLKICTSNKDKCRGIHYYILVGDRNFRYIGDIDYLIMKKARINLNKYREILYKHRAILYSNDLCNSRYSFESLESI